MANPINPQIKRVLIQKILQARARKKKVKLPRPGKMKYPKMIEMSYMRDLQVISDALIKIVREMMYPKVKELVEQASKLRPDSKTIRIDEYQTQLDNVVSGMNIAFSQKVNDSDIKAIALRNGKRVNDFNQQEVKKSYEKVIGIDVFASEPWLNQEMNAFVSSNVKLIKTVPDEFFGRVEKIVSQGVRAGTLTEDIVNELEDKVEPWAESRLDFIARDQVSKFNGQLNMLRQTEIGVSSYTWETSQDERVRPSHEEKQGNVYRWDDPPADTGHPGEDYQCRCVAIPVIDDLVDQVDEEV